MEERRTDTHNAQAALSEAIRDLRQVDTTLTRVRESLSSATVASAELRGLVEVVQTDLLADVIDTLGLVVGNGAISG